MLRKFLTIAVISASLFSAGAAGTAPAAGAVVAKNALIYGDSLTYESRFQLADRFALRAGWTQHTHGVAQTAPCDWLQSMPADLASYQPSVVGVLTAGNTGGTACMTAPTGSVEYYAQYRADLASLFAMVTATGAKLVFFNAPPFVNADRNATAKQINAIALDLAYQYRGVSIAGTVRTALSNSGAYTQTKPCIPTETAAMGCTGGRITIRTLPGFTDYGLHLCPTGLPAGTFGICSTYSSGEYRFARAMTNSLASPPKPKLP
ncbi:MAG: hypothetical protein ABIP21_04355 [Acidimicrobiia bacterium]